MNKKICPLALALFFSIFSITHASEMTIPAISAEWLISFEQAAEKAKDENKFILLNFSGSDWCAPCIRMKKEIFQVEKFVTFAEENLVLLNADFPRGRKNKLATEQQKINDQLAEKYNPQGNFPMTVLLKPDGKVLHSWEGLPKLSPEAFIDEIKSYLPKPGPTSTGMKTYSRTLLLMGSRFHISVVAQQAEWAIQQIDLAIAEIQRIERLISSWDEHSQTSAINRQAGIAPVRTDPELIGLIERANKISELTQGAFDLTFGSIDKNIWRFDGSMTKLPDPTIARQAVWLINYKNIFINNNDQTVFLKEPGMVLGFGAIGKGYAAEKAKALLLANGVASGVVNAGGDLTAWGNQPNGLPWTIGIANPDAKLEAFSYLEITDQAVVTSGNYEKFIEIDGKRYTHIIDPRSGYPVSGLKSVTIICPNAELADALATSVFVLGREVGIDLINQLPDVHCIIVDDQQQTFSSNNIEIN